MANAFKTSVWQKSRHTVRLLLNGSRSLSHSLCLVVKLQPNVCTVLSADRKMRGMNGRS